MTDAGPSREPLRLKVATVIAEGADRLGIESALAAAGLDVLVSAYDADDLSSGAVPPLDAVVIAVDGASSPERAVGLVRAHLGDAAIVVVTAEMKRGSMRDVIGVGADGVVLERQLGRCLGLAVRAACSGQLVLPADFRPQVAKPRLSARERQILAMVVLGFTNGEIARKLYLAEATVKSHLSSAFAKLGVRSRSEATQLILDPESGLGTGILAISNGDEEAAAPAGAA